MFPSCLLSQTAALVFFFFFFFFLPVQGQRLPCLHKWVLIGSQHSTEADGRNVEGAGETLAVSLDRVVWGETFTSL